MNEWEEEVRRRQGEMFTLVHLRQRSGQAADQAGPEQTRSKLFGYQPDPVGCHLILREQKPAERRPWRVRNVGRNCVWSRRNCVWSRRNCVWSRRNCVWSAVYAGIPFGPQGARRGVFGFCWTTLAS